MHNEIPLLQKIYDFYKLFYGYLDHFPKKSREVLIAKIEQTILELLQIIAQISFAKPVDKYQGLANASTKADLLKVLFRLCFELKIIDQKKYIQLEQDINEIGRMIGGWLRSLKTSNR